MGICADGVLEDCDKSGDADPVGIVLKFDDEDEVVDD